MAERHTADGTYSDTDDGSLPGRYADIQDREGRTVIYDIEDPGAWIRSDATIDAAEVR